MKKFNENETNEVGDGQRKFMFSLRGLWLFLIFCVIGTSVVGFLYFNGIKVDALNDFHQWIQSLIGILVVVVGGVYVEARYRKNRKGGTKYYRFKYENPEMKSAMKHYCDKVSIEKKMRAFKTIYQWINSDEAEETYWKTVFYLQNIDKDFVKAWNDFNFYGSKDIKKDSEVEYYVLLKTYIYLRVYNTYSELEKC